MRKKEKADVLGMIAKFQKNILAKKPSLDRMVDEVHMMSFKIKPLAGDVSTLNLRDENFIEILWNLGKLDELFQKEHKKLNEKDKKVFFDYFDDLYDQLQTQLNKVNLRAKSEFEVESAIEMEIFKEEKKRRRTN